MCQGQPSRWHPSEEDLQLNSRNCSEATPEIGNEPRDRIGDGPSASLVLYERGWSRHRRCLSTCTMTSSVLIGHGDELRDQGSSPLTVHGVSHRQSRTCLHASRCHLSWLLGNADNNSNKTSKVETAAYLCGGQPQDPPFSDTSRCRMLSSPCRVLRGGIHEHSRWCVPYALENAHRSLCSFLGSPFQPGCRT